MNELGGIVKELIPSRLQPTSGDKHVKLPQPTETAQAIAATGLFLSHSSVHQRAKFQNEANLAEGRMTSFRRIEANRRNAQLSTGPKTDDGKSRSRRNAVRHGLTAETVIDALEDADEYAAFEMAVTSDYDAQTAVERELVLRLASALWRLRRATSIESGLFRIQAQHLLQFRQRRAQREKPLGDVLRFEVAISEGEKRQEDWLSSGLEDRAGFAPPDRDCDLTASFVRLVNLPTAPLDRLSRYEAMLWRQACQILFTLRCLELRKL